ncbi:MAG: hypothetical protein V7742_22730 [Halioglobus sp.]
MIRTIMLVCLTLLVYTMPGVAKDKDSSAGRAVNDVIYSGIYDDDHHKGKGRPGNPGEHGRDNAAQKQRENPGNGSKGGDSWEDIIRDEVDDGGKKNKGKGRKHK